MTNLAAAILLEPSIVDRLGTVVIMGGARSEGGNVTASAEFNVFADAHAAHIVLSAVKDAVVLGLDATHQVRTTRERAERIRRLGGPRAEACARLFDFCLKTWEQLGDDGGAPLHDPCTIAWLLQPELFMLRPCRIEVETGSTLTMGHTAVEFRLPEPDTATARWAVKADGQGVFDLLAESLAR
jgi:purine nucleosidase